MTSEDNRSSGLFYFGTRDEVRLGDRVRVKRFLRRADEGVVCYIPGMSAPHRELEFGGMRRWAIQKPDGSLLVMAFAPHQSGARRGIELVARGASYTAPNPREQLEEPGAFDGEDEEDTPSPSA